MKKVKLYTCKLCGSEETTKSNIDAKHSIDRCVSCFNIYHKEAVLLRRKERKASLDAVLALKKESKAEAQKELSDKIDSELKQLKPTSKKGDAQTKKDVKRRLEALLAERELKQINEEYA